MFSRKLWYTTSSLQVTTYYKNNSIINIFPCQKMIYGSDHSQHLQSPPPLLWHSTLQNPEDIKFQIIPPSRGSTLIRRKTILQVSTRLLAYYWELSTTTWHLVQSPHHCLLQKRILKGHPNTFPPIQTNIPAPKEHLQ